MIDDEMVGWYHRLDGHEFESPGATLEFIYSFGHAAWLVGS